MKKTVIMLISGLIFISALIITLTDINTAAIGETKDELFLAYPPQQHETTADQIFFIGTAPGTVYINGDPIEQTEAGHFAPSLPLEMGKNQFTLRHKEQEISVTVKRVSPVPKPPSGGGFASETIFPSKPLARLPGELICLEVVGSPQADVSATLSQRQISLKPQSKHALPSNYAALTENNKALSELVQLYQGCFKAETPGNLGNPVYKMTLEGKTFTASNTEDITILDPEKLDVVEVTAQQGEARTGPGTTHSRLTPLPKGTRAIVNGREGKWLRLQYGAWINGEQTTRKPDAVPTQTIIRSIQSQQKSDATEIIFPLQVPVPVSVEQGDDTFTLTLHHTTAQTNTIQLDDDPLIERLDWQQVEPDTVRYEFNLKSDQQWGYDLNYQGTNLLLSLKHPPQTDNNFSQPLSGMSILIDPGHGGKELGAQGPTGYPEKKATLATSKVLQQELEKLGATTYMTRETDKAVSLQQRMEMINNIQPTIALSVHYNALPDNGDAMNTAGIGTFWYNPPAHDLSVFLHNYLVDELNRPSYGIFWKTLALTRPHTTLAILLELGFMINPTEFEWIRDPQNQEKLAKTIAEGIKVWWQQQSS